MHIILYILLIVTIIQWLYLKPQVIYVQSNIISVTTVVSTTSRTSILGHFSNSHNIAELYKVNRKHPCGGKHYFQTVGLCMSVVLCIALSNSILPYPLFNNKQKTQDSSHQKPTNKKLKQMQPKCLPGDGWIFKMW